MHTQKHLDKMRKLMAGNTHGVRHGHTHRTADGKVYVSPTYKSWMSMKARCLNVNAPNYRWYGGRGITIFERWLVFENFLDDMGERPAGTSLDRIDSDGNYSPENCRWADAATQGSNTKAGRRGLHANSQKNLLHVGTTKFAMKAWATRRARYGPTGLKGD